LRFIDIFGDRRAQCLALLLVGKDAGGVERGEGRLKQRREALLGRAGELVVVAVKYVAGQSGRCAAGADRRAKHEQAGRVGDAHARAHTSLSRKAAESSARPKAPMTQPLRAALPSRSALSDMPPAKIEIRQRRRRRCRGRLARRSRCSAS
jgi:hypothetical protein